MCSVVKFLHIISLTFFIRDSCTIGFQTKFIITGGKYSFNKAMIYNEYGWVSDLPDLLTGNFSYLLKKIRLKMSK